MQLDEIALVAKEVVRMIPGFKGHSATGSGQGGNDPVLHAVLDGPGSQDVLFLVGIITDAVVIKQNQFCSTGCTFKKRT